MKKSERTFVVIVLGLLLGFGFFQWQASIASDTAVKAKTQVIESISPADAAAMIDKNKNDPNFVILDVRTPNEYGPEHISGAMILDYYAPSFRTNIGQLDKAKTYLIYCRTGRRSGVSRDMMRELGFLKVYDIAGGIAAWKAKGLPHLEGRFP